MTDYRWLSRTEVEAIHHMQIAQFGGAAGLRDGGLLDSALARPQNLAAYGEPELHELAAAYAFGLVRNYPFVDGNKRTALVSAYAFLGWHDVTLTAPEPEAVATMQSLAAGVIDEATLAAWIGAHLEAH